MIELLQSAGFTYTLAVVTTGSVLLGILAGLTGVPLVLRQRSLVGDALAHTVLPGVALGFIIAGGVKHQGILLLGAGISGLIGMLLIVGLERRQLLRQDATIGVVLSGFFALGIVLLTWISHNESSGQAGLETYLFGQAAAMHLQDVTIFFYMAIIVIGIYIVTHVLMRSVLFDAGFTQVTGVPVILVDIMLTSLLVIVIVLGLQTVGAILMVALLVAPTAAARRVTANFTMLMIWAGVIGGVGAGTGALLSAQLGMPTGPLIVLTVAAIFFLFSTVAGIRRRWQLHRMREWGFNGS